ncbi:MAG: DUF1836 domain-containing protein [bacterium]
MYSFDELKEELLAAGLSLESVPPEDIPGIDLYMDQVTTFIDDETASMKRHPEDKPLTKSMIQNYTKHRLLPPPEKKKYSREHVILLLFIYYLKDFMSINDIPALKEKTQGKLNYCVTVDYQTLAAEDARGILTEEMVRSRL